VKVGDIVKLSASGAKRPRAVAPLGPEEAGDVGLVVSRFNALHLHILWAGTDRPKLFSEVYLELINANR